MLMSATGLSESVVIAVEGAENRLFRVQALVSWNSEQHDASGL